LNRGDALQIGGRPRLGVSRKLARTPAATTRRVAGAGAGPALPDVARPAAERAPGTARRGSTRRPDGEIVEGLVVDLDANGSVPGAPFNSM
jgi:hypothetical protein